MTERLKKRILLVEDDALDAELTLQALAEVNGTDEVHHVKDGQETLDFLHCRGKWDCRSCSPPDVIFLDLHLPGLNGLETLIEIRKDSRLGLIPVVMLTSSNSGRDMLSCYRAGVNAYVVKPIEYEQFTAVVKQLYSFWSGINLSPSEILEGTL